MKKGLFLLLAIITLGTIHVSADVAAPILEDRVIRVEIKDTADINRVKESIDKVDGVFSSSITDSSTTGQCTPCEKCEVCSNTNNSLSDEDIKSLKMTTLLIYIALGVLIVLMIIVIALMIARRKKDSKKDA